MGEKHWLAVQFPMKSLQGSQRDNWLKDKVTEYLDTYLGEAGLGHVDGFDMGRSVANPKQYALNIFCVVEDEAKGIALVKKVLKDHRLDYTKIRIATMSYENGETYTLKYAYKKGVTEFSL